MSFQLKEYHLGHISITKALKIDTKYMSLHMTLILNYHNPDLHLLNKLVQSCISEIM